MMQLIKLLILLFFIFPYSAYADMDGYTLGSSNQPQGVPSDCSPMDANASYYMNFDHSTSTVTACTDGGTLTGTLTTATVTTGQNHTSGGAYALYGDGTDNQAAYITFSNSGGELSGDEGYVEMWVYPTDVTDDNQLFYTANTNYMRVWIETDRTVKFYFSAGNLSDLVSTNLVTLNAWNHIEFRWNNVSNQISVNVDDAGWENKSDVDISAWGANQPTEFLIGNEATSYQLAGYIDDVQIWQTDDKTVP